MAGKNTYRSANGQNIDMERIILKNEGVRAVGNMSVNGRGDVIDSNNKTIASRSAQVNKNYKKQTANAAQNTSARTKPVAEKVDNVIVGLDDVAQPVAAPVKEPVKEAASTPTDNKKGGLAGALAKASKKK